MIYWFWGIHDGLVCGLVVQDTVSHGMRKSVFGVFDQVKNPNWPAHL